MASIVRALRNASASHPFQVFNFAMLRNGPKGSLPFLFLISPAVRSSVFQPDRRFSRADPRAVLAEAKRPWDMLGGGGVLHAAWSMQGPESEKVDPAGRIDALVEELPE